MTETNPIDERQPISLALLRGAFVGLAVVGFGVIRKAAFLSLSVGWKFITSELVGGAVGGAIIALVLALTVGLRRRGFVWHMTVWIIASIIALLVVVSPAIPEQGWYPVKFGVAFGAIAGIALGGQAWIYRRKHPE